MSNIKDYLSHYIANNNLTEIKYTVGSHDSQNHEDTIKDFILTRNLGKGEGVNILLDNEENKGRKRGK